MRGASVAARAAGQAHTRLAVVAVLAITAVWGSTFFMLKDTIERVPVLDFLAVRFLLATAALWLIRPRSVSALSRRELRAGVVLGLLCGAGQVFQGVGLETTSASVSGFVTGMYVVFTPLLGALVLRIRVAKAVWAAVALATAGLALLSLQGLAIGRGEALTLVGAVFLAAHILGLARWSSGRNAVGLTVVQLATMTVVCGIGALPGGITTPTTSVDWLVLVYMALVAGAGALVVQTWAQSQLPATRAAIIMTMEPVWAAAFAVALGGEVLGPRAVAGGLLVVAAMYVVELGPGSPESRALAEETVAAAHLGQR